MTPDPAAPAPHLTDAVAHRHSAQLSMLQRIAASLGRTEGADALPPLFVDAIVAGMGASWAALYRCQPDGSLSCDAVHPGDADVPATIRGEDAERLDSMEAPPVLLDAAGVRIAGLASAAMLAPIEDVRARLGWLAVGERADGAAGFDEHDSRFLALLASLAAPRLAFAEFIATRPRLALVDEATGFGNRRAFDQRVEEELARANRSGVPFCLVLVELDRFAEFEKGSARAVVEAALAGVSGAISVSIRRSDIPFRFEGGRLAVILWNADPVGGRIAADRIRRSIEARMAPLAAAQLTASVGLAALTLPVNGPLALSSITLEKKADEALHRARRSGGNVTVSSSDTHATSMAAVPPPRAPAAGPH